MHIYDPTGELHLQQIHDRRVEELKYAAKYCAFLLAIFILVMAFGGNQ